VILVAALNVGYFGIEFAVALAIGSVSLFADGVDFLEDASVNKLVALALNWNARNRGAGRRPAGAGSGDALDRLAKDPPSCSSWTWRGLARSW
jgi:Co/Zn/Cd efflux system component